jgi:hypothetical protein
MSKYVDYYKNIKNWFFNLVCCLAISYTKIKWNVLKRHWSVSKLQLKIENAIYYKSET